MLWSCDTKTKNVDSCGDDFRDPTEDCDGPDLRNMNCIYMGYSGGRLSCTSACIFDESECQNVCGNNLLEPSEECGDGSVNGTDDCDGSDLSGATCASLGHGSGSLACAADCTFNESACVPRSTNADLDTLTVSSGTLTPNFSASTIFYSVTVTTAVWRAACWCCSSTSGTCGAPRSSTRS
ncbi:MAG: hypothetical protein CVU65_14840 [Deltaproteobacteria bacterium HGW-Deltaproteobacteria-22]|jgi:hypothetical protein|nr:MAG: hypothetical protein CVU65_14840 [Deltaproteobacteria bacterium HGW-Deltaproteobacteria-22]